MNLLDLIRTHVPHTRHLDLRVTEPSTLRDILYAGYADGRPILARLAWLGALVETARAVRPGHVIEIPAAVLASGRFDAEQFEREVEAHGRVCLCWVEAITRAEPERMVFVALPASDGRAEVPRGA